MSNPTISKPDPIRVTELGLKMLKEDPNADQPIDYRIAALNVARAALEAEQSRQIQLALLSKAFR